MASRTRPPATAVPARSTSRWPRRDARRAQPRRPAQRLSPRRAAGVGALRGRRRGGRHEPRTLYRLATAIFDYIDGISAESIEGFTQERAAAEGEAQRRRRALARLLARDDVAPRRSATSRAWPDGRAPPRCRALVVGDGTGDDEPDTDRLASRLGGGAIAAAEGALAIAWIPDPRGAGPARAARVGARRRTRRAGARGGARASALQPRPRPRRVRPGPRRARQRRPARGGRRAPARPAAARRRRGARRPTSPPAPWRRSTTCAPAPAVACAPRCARGSTIPGR